MAETTQLLSPSRQNFVYPSQFFSRHTFFHITSTKVRYIETIFDVLFAISLTKIILHLFAIQHTLFQLVYLLTVTDGSILQYFPNSQTMMSTESITSTASPFVITSVSQLNDLFSYVTAFISNFDDAQHILPSSILPKSILQSTTASIINNISSTKSSSILTQSTTPWILREHPILSSSISQYLINHFPILSKFPTITTTPHFFCVLFPIILQIALLWFIHTQYHRFSNKFGHFKSMAYHAITFPLGAFYLYLLTIALTEETSIYTIFSALTHHLHEYQQLSWTPGEIFSSSSSIIQLYSRAIFFNLHIILPITCILFIFLCSYIYFAYQSIFVLEMHPLCIPSSEPIISSQIDLKSTHVAPLPSALHMNSILGEYTTSSTSDQSSMTQSAEFSSLLPQQAHQYLSSLPLPQISRSNSSSISSYYPYPITPIHHKIISILSLILYFISILPFTFFCIFFIFYQSLHSPHIQKGFHHVKSNAISTTATYGTSWFPTTTIPLISLVFLLLVDFFTPYLLQKALNLMKYSTNSVTTYCHHIASLYPKSNTNTTTSPFFVFYRDPATFINQYLYSQRQAITLIAFIACFATTSLSSLLQLIQPQLHHYSHIISEHHKELLSATGSDSMISTSLTNFFALFGLNTFFFQFIHLYLFFPPLIVFHFITLTLLILFSFLYFTKSTHISKLLSPIEHHTGLDTKIQVPISSSNQLNNEHLAQISNHHPQSKLAPYGALDTDFDPLEQQHLQHQQHIQQHNKATQSSQLFPSFISPPNTQLGIIPFTQNSNEISFNQIDLFLENDELLTFDPVHNLQFSSLNNPTLLQQTQINNNIQQDHHNGNNNDSLITNSSFNTYHQTYNSLGLRPTQQNLNQNNFDHSHPNSSNEQIPIESLSHVGTINRQHSESDLHLIPDDISNYFIDMDDEDADLLFIPQYHKFPHSKQFTQQIQGYNPQQHHQSQHLQPPQQQHLQRHHPQQHQQHQQQQQQHQHQQLSPNPTTSPHYQSFPIAQSFLNLSSLLFIIMISFLYSGISNFTMNYTIIYFNSFTLAKPITIALCTYFTATLPTLASTSYTSYPVSLSLWSFFSPLEFFLISNVFFVLSILIRFLFQRLVFPVVISSTQTLHQNIPPGQLSTRTSPLDSKLSLFYRKDEFNETYRPHSLSSSSFSNESSCPLFLSPIHFIAQFTANLHSTSMKRRNNFDNLDPIDASENNSLFSSSSPGHSFFQHSNTGSDSSSRLISMTNYDLMELKFRQILKVSYTIDSFYNVEIIHTDNDQQNDIVNILGPPPSTESETYPSHLPTPAQLQHLHQRHLTLAMYLHYTLLAALFLPLILLIVYKFIAFTPMHSDSTVSFVDFAVSTTWSLALLPPISSPFIGSKFTHIDSLSSTLKSLFRALSGLSLYLYFLSYPLLIIALVIAIDRFYKHCYRYYHRLLLLLLYDDDSTPSDNNPQSNNPNNNLPPNDHIHHIHAANKPAHYSQLHSEISIESPSHKYYTNINPTSTATGHNVMDEYTRTMLAETDDYYANPYEPTPNHPSSHQSISHQHPQQQRHPQYHPQSQFGHILKSKSPSKKPNQQPHLTNNPITYSSPHPPLHLVLAASTITSPNRPSNKSQTDEVINYSPITPKRSMM